jgi:predicted Fe-Mo cluster-binding NifX family protein
VFEKELIWQLDYFRILPYNESALVRSAPFDIRTTKEGEMRFLVATVGNTLESQVAKHFEHAAWYLIVDDFTRTFDAARNVSPTDHHSILTRASSDDVDIVIGGKFTMGSLRQIVGRDLRIAHAHGVSVQVAIAKIKAGEIQTQSELAPPEPGEKFMTRTPAVTMRGKQKRVLEARYAPGSLRGQHHLQQYGGRGH